MRWVLLRSSGIYVDPPLEAELIQDDNPMMYDGAIPTSFGMDFIEVQLDPARQGQPLTVMVEAEGAVAHFNVEVWKLNSGKEKPHALTPQPENATQDAKGTHAFMIPSVDTTAYDRLALIITRLDADESADPVGKYRVTLKSEAVLGF